MEQNEKLLMHFSQIKELLENFFVWQHKNMGRFNEQVEPENIVDTYFRERHGIEKVEEIEAQSTEPVSDLEWPCQNLHGGSGSNIYSNKDGMCKHPECHPYTEPVSEGEIEDVLSEYRVNVFLNTPEENCDENTEEAWKSRRVQQKKKLAQAIHKLIYGDSPNKVKEPSMCPICDSDDVFSFKQTSHKCRSCDYRFTK